MGARENGQAKVAIKEVSHSTRNAIEGKMGQMLINADDTKPYRKLEATSGKCVTGRVSGIVLRGRG